MRLTAMVFAALCAAGGLAGCSPGDPMDDPFAHYARRIMTVDETAGNTQAANLAIQTVDPWPRYVNNTRIPANGARMSDAFETYQGADAKSSGGASGGSSGASAGASPAAPAL